MAILPNDTEKNVESNSNRLATTDTVPQTRSSKTLHERRLQLQRLTDQRSDVLQTIISNSRVLIIEGISGAGKDTFQKYLKSKLRDRIVYDYSEGELLLSWNQRPIKNICRLQIHLMKSFVDYMADTLRSDDKAVFLLNRFHLSMYTMSISQQPTLERAYNSVLKKLRLLPTHIFILQLMESEIEARSSHPERGNAWRKYQQHIIQREGFQNFLKRNISLQKGMVETAIRQQIPFSIFRLSSVLHNAINGRRAPLVPITSTMDISLSNVRHWSDEHELTPQDDR